MRKDEKKKRTLKEKKMRPRKGRKEEKEEKGVVSYIHDEIKPWDATTQTDRV